MGSGAKRRRARAVTCVSLVTYVSLWHVSLRTAGAEPFWTLRVFATAEVTEDLIKKNTEKHDKIDAFIAECRESEARAAFVETLKAANAVPSPQGEGEEDAEPAGAEEGEEAAGDEPAAWPPVKSEEQTWGEYLAEYRSHAKLQAKDKIVKRDPARNGVPSQDVQPRAHWVAAQEAAAAADAENSAQREAGKAQREADKEAREEAMAKTKAEMKEKVAARTARDFSAETQGSLLQRRAEVLKRMEAAKAFVLALAEKLTEIEVATEDVEGAAEAEPRVPVATVKRDDQQLVEKLMAAVTSTETRSTAIRDGKVVAAVTGSAGDQVLWAEVLAALRAREAGPLLDALEDGATEVAVEDVVSYQSDLAHDKWGTQLQRITAANDAEETRLREEAEAAEQERLAALEEEA